MEFNATFLVAAASFIAFTLIMEKIFYAPISGMIAKREAYFNENKAVTDENYLMAKKIRDDKDKEVLAAKTDAKNMIMSEVDIANQIKAEKELSLKNEMQNNVEEQKSALNNEKSATSSEMKMNLDDISNSILAKLTGGES